MTTPPLPPLAVSLVGVAAAWIGYKARVKGLRMLQWPSVRGVVSAGKIVKESDQMDRYGGTTYNPVVRFDYFVGGREYRGRRLGVVSFGASWPGYAERVVARHPRGAEVVVYYDPDNPGDSVLDRADAVSAPTALFVFGVAMACGGLLWIWLTRG